jgi:hypothetical protein
MGRPCQRSSPVVTSPAGVIPAPHCPSCWGGGRRGEAPERRGRGQPGLAGPPHPRAPQPQRPLVTRPSRGLAWTPRDPDSRLRPAPAGGTVLVCLHRTSPPPPRARRGPGKSSATRRNRAGNPQLRSGERRAGPAPSRVTRDACAGRGLAVLLWLRMTRSALPGRSATAGSAWPPGPWRRFASSVCCWGLRPGRRSRPRARNSGLASRRPTS